MRFQCACPTGWMSEEREEFWSKLDEVVESVPRGVSGVWRRLQWIYRWKGNRSDGFWVGVVLGGMQKVKWSWIFTIFTSKRRGRGEGVETGSGFEEELPDDWDSTGVWCVLWSEKRRQGDLVTEWGSTGKHSKEMVRKEKFGIVKETSGGICWEINSWVLLVLMINKYK